jgi:hypothetical protein
MSAYPAGRSPFIGPPAKPPVCQIPKTYRACRNYGDQPFSQSLALHEAVTHRFVIYRDSANPRDSVPRSSLYGLMALLPYCLMALPTAPLTASGI